MAKKQNPRILSPENYIRQRARNLPLFKCFINASWRIDGLAHITIARRHINGNITFCAYLVDLHCLGIKDTYYRFNSLEEEFYDFQKQALGSFEVEEAEYNLVHNIIHAGWEFAESVGFQPHRDFLSVTRYMLNEDTDDIPIIEIHCGDEDGKPFFIQGPLESNMEADRIVRELRKNVGDGNFKFVLDEGDGSSDEKYDGDHDDIYCDIRSEYEENSYDDNVRHFLALSQFMDEENHGLEDGDTDDEQDDVYIRLEVLSDIIYEEIVDDDEVDDWILLWDKDSLISFEATAHMLGLSDGESLLEEEIECVSNTRDPGVLEPYIRERWGEVPYIQYMRLRRMQDSSEKNREIARVLAQCPDYGLLKTEQTMMRVAVDPSGFVPEDFLCSCFYGDREEITPIEYVQLQYLRTIYFLNTNNYSGLESLYLYNGHNLEDIDRYGDMEAFNSFLLVSRISKLRSYLLNEKND